ncbi:hypothetical protein ACFXC8_54225, partial [Streptomyces sp. NPDC059441]|uniref:hypothetical protein n=1 Tax=Streptomyces sp. NPDC059441 TaxID=3346829 RepID=UPI0036B07024
CAVSIPTRVPARGGLRRELQRGHGRAPALEAGGADRAAYADAVSQYAARERDGLRGNQPARGLTSRRG